MMMYSLSCISSQIPFAFTAFDLHPSGNHMHTASVLARLGKETSTGQKQKAGNAYPAAFRSFPAAAIASEKIIPESSLFSTAGPVHGLF
jgi:hypothetical protein